MKKLSTSFNPEANKTVGTFEKIQNEIQNAPTMKQDGFMMVILSVTKTEKIGMDSNLRSTLMTMGVSKLNIFNDFSVLAPN